jgi:hypothetical protein
MDAKSQPRSMKRGRKRVWQWVGVVALSVCAAVTVAVRYVVDHAAPILRARVIQTLSTRFDSKVELAGFQVSVLHGIEVSGTGLEIFGTSDPNPYQPGVQPLIEIGEFRFQTALRSLFRSPMHVDTVYVKGMVLNVPPRQNRKQLTSMNSRAGRLTIFVDKFVCEDTRLLINTINPEKAPLEFAISSLQMKEIGPGLPLRFQATLVNPKPVGDIQSTGLFGPFQQESPRDTPVQGNYIFSDADLSTIKGIGGMLSSTGEYSGTLSNIAVHGTTDTPDFKIAISGHPVPLHTEFHAVVDGTSGDTHLKPVRASFLHSSLIANGSVIRMSKGKGHDIELDVTVEKGRIEDLLRVGVRTEPAVMSGAVQMKTHLSLRPGEDSVVDRMKLGGDFDVEGAHFSNEKVQNKIDSLSLLTQGKPMQAREAVVSDVPVELQGNFQLSDGLLSFSLLHFVIPGTHVDMSGSYSLDGQLFDFHGTARLDAKVSQMTTGWKSILLKPVDPFFSKNGAGTEIPIKVTGTQSEPHFGLDFGRKEEHDNSGHASLGANQR